MGTQRQTAGPAPDAAAGTPYRCARCRAAWTMPPGAPRPARCPACGSAKWDRPPAPPATKLEIVPVSPPLVLRIAADPRHG